MSRISRVISDLPKHKDPLRFAKQSRALCGCAVGCSRCRSCRSAARRVTRNPRLQFQVHRYRQCLCDRAATLWQAVTLEEVKLPPLCNHISGQCAHDGV